MLRINSVRRKAEEISTKTQRKECFDLEAGKLQTEKKIAKLNVTSTCMHSVSAMRVVNNCQKKRLVTNQPLDVDAVYAAVHLL